MRVNMVRISLAVALLFGAAPVAAQTFGVGAHAGASIPTGEYGDRVDLGFLGGLDLWYPVADVAGGLSWYSSADAIAHSLTDVDDSGYFFVPIMTGLRLDVPVGPVALFGTGQVGLLLTRGPDFDIGPVADLDGELGTSFGYNIGAGVQLSDYLYGGVRYWPLGTRTFEYEGDLSVEEEVSFFDIYVGFGVH